MPNRHQATQLNQEHRHKVNKSHFKDMKITIMVLI